MPQANLFNSSLFIQSIDLRSFFKCWVIFLFISIVVLSGCSSTSSLNDEQQKMQDVYHSWKGTPYKLGGNSKSGVDCSGFTKIAMQDVYNLNLPRTTKQLSTQGKKVSLANAKYGDLVFFKTGKNTQHVGIYIGNREFLHASTSKGVIISKLDNVYWKSKFWQIRRVTAMM